MKVDWSLDTDQDGTPDWAEFEVAARGTGMLVPGVVGDAFNEDTNNDGIPDGLQIDSDLDGTPDSNDINKSDNTASFPIGPAPRYALFPITNAQPAGSKSSPLQINDKGTVLYESGTWKGGVWTPLTLDVTGQIINAGARGINDSDTILGIGYDDAVSVFPDYFAGLACYWPTPTDLPSIVEMAGANLVRATNIETGTTAGDLIANRLCPGPFLANDGGFYFPKNRLKADRSSWMFENHSRWKLPSNGQPVTETSASAAMRYSTGPGLQWGFDPAQTVGSITAGGSIEGAGTLPVLPFMPTNVIVQPGGSVLAMPPLESEEKSLVFIQGAWKESPTFADAIDIAASGTAIGKAHDELTAPISINGKWTGIERTLPIDTDVFDPPSPWYDGSVTLLDTTPGGWILTRKGNYAPYEYAAMLPIRAEGYYSNSAEVSITEAVGVDDFSIGSETPGVEVQDKIWIMAPQGGFNKIVKFKSPLNANTPVNLSASNILFGGQESTTISGAISPVVLRAADTVLSGGERMMTLTMGSGSNEVSSISKPIGLKIMKGRTVKVTVYKVTKLYGTSAEEEVDAIMMPTQNEIIDHLNDMFRPQINTTFSVNLVDKPLEARWDAPSGPNGVPNGHFDIQTGVGPLGEEAAILAEVPANPPAYDIRVFIVANPGSPLGTGADAFGLTLRDQRTCWVHGSLFGKNRSKSYLLDTIAHEIGHVLVGEGHPDKTTGNPGPAPLPGTRHNCRLMCSGPNSNGSSRLLVKKEWDEAEKWMKTEIDDKEPQ